MENTKMMRQKEAVRLLQWIAENPDDWDELCTCEEVLMTNQRCISYIQQLQEAELYPIILVLLTRNFGQREVGTAIVKMAITAFAQQCEDEGMDNLIRKVIAALRAEG